MSTTNRFSEDKDKSSVGDPEQRIPSPATVSARARNKSRLRSLSRGALKDDLVYQLSSAAKVDFKTLEITKKYHEQAKTVLYRRNTTNRPKQFFIE